jgi:hypothetical protein
MVERVVPQLRGVVQRMKAESREVLALLKREPVHTEPAHPLDHARVESVVVDHAETSAVAEKRFACSCVDLLRAPDVVVEDPRPVPSRERGQLQQEAMYGVRFAREHL